MHNYEEVVFKGAL